MSRNVLPIHKTLEIFAALLLSTFIMALAGFVAGGLSMQVAIAVIMVVSNLFRVLLFKRA